MAIVPAGGGAGQAIATRSMGGAVSANASFASTAWKPGAYDAVVVRNGAVVGGRTRFHVYAAGAKPTLSTDKTSYAQGEPIRMRGSATHVACTGCAHACTFRNEAGVHDMHSCIERADALAARVGRLVDLRRSERAGRRLAAVIFNFPPNAGNTGTAALTLGTVTISGANASEYKVTTQPSASVAAGSSTTFTVQFMPLAIGTRTATLSFSENDPSTTSPFTFAISGVSTL